MTATTMNITLEEAETLRTRAIARAIELDIVNMVRYILINEPSIPDGIDRSAPLPGSGMILKTHSAGDNVFTVEVVLADNETDRVFVYERTTGGEAYKCFREGPWAALLAGHYEALKYRLENRATMRLLKDYTPYGDPKRQRYQ